MYFYLKWTNGFCWFKKVSIVVFCRLIVVFFMLKSAGLICVRDVIISLSFEIDSHHKTSSISPKITTFIQIHFRTHTHTVFHRMLEKSIGFVSKSWYWLSSNFDLSRRILCVFVCACVSQFNLIGYSIRVLVKPLKISFWCRRRRQQQQHSL